VSATPRTGKNRVRFSTLCHPEDAWWVHETVSAQLEHELNAANKRISKLNNYVAALETAGDLMANELSYGYDVDMWNQAKEAKP
jgi:hypothetical protein